MFPDTLPVLGPPGRHDLYLSPHTDDACFSLGALARSRGAGQLVTVFPLSNYQAQVREGKHFGVRETSLRRIHEDARFARACGLRHRVLEHADSSARNEQPFDMGNAQGLSRNIDASLLRALAGPVVGLGLAEQPWLFCPMGIGSHVDHLAVLLVVTRHLKPLSQMYRIAFYEDLHYASDARRRDDGLKVFHQRFPEPSLVRVEVPLADAASQAAKMALVEIYESQLTPELRTISRFTPGVSDGAQPHEAFWVLAGDMHQAPG